MPALAVCLKYWREIALGLLALALIGAGLYVRSVFDERDQLKQDKAVLTEKVKSAATMQELTNTIADAIDAAIAPAGSDLALGRNTLGGTVFACRIEGPVKKVPGDLDGDGLLWMQVKLVFP